MVGILARTHSCHRLGAIKHGDILVGDGDERLRVIFDTHSRVKGYERRLVALDRKRADWVLIRTTDLRGILKKYKAVLRAEGVSVSLFQFSYFATGYQRALRLFETAQEEVGSLSLAHSIYLVRYLEENRYRWDGLPKRAWERDPETRERFLKIVVPQGPDGETTTCLYYRRRNKIVVLFNHTNPERHEEPHPIKGTGGYKKVKCAYELIEGVWLAEGVSKNEEIEGVVENGNIEAAIEEADFARLVRGIPGFLPIVGARHWLSKTVLPSGAQVIKYALRTPLCTTDLEKAIRDGVLTRSHKLDIMRQLLTALATMYEQTGIVHRDIKPSNILLRKVGKRYQVQITDFGIACLKGGWNLTGGASEIQATGTPGYTAPEYLALQEDRSVCERHFAREAYRLTNEKVDVFSVSQVLKDLFPDEIQAVEIAQESEALHVTRIPETDSIRGLYIRMAERQQEARLTLRQSLEAFLLCT